MTQPARTWNAVAAWLWRAATAVPSVAAAVTASEETGPSPFAVEVVYYDPAPGQFVNSVGLGDPSRALGAPDGHGLFTGNGNSVVTLGGFGGSLILRFDHVVEDHPLNPLGLDAIVFGNAFWVGGDPRARWAECATIEIALDADGSGAIDGKERWFLIPGSHLPTAAMMPATVTWDDDIMDTTYPPALTAWIPPGRSGVWTTVAFALPHAVFSVPVLFNDSTTPDRESVFGYADASPTLLLGDLDGDDMVDDPSLSPEDFYTVPDDPFTVGVDAGSGGGDAFDIAWAIDPQTGAPAGLTGFNMIRLINPVHAVLGPIGEKSPEIDAVADVRADLFGDADADEDIDLRDIAELGLCFEPGAPPAPTCAAFVRAPASPVDGAVATEVIRRMTGPRRAK